MSSVDEFQGGIAAAEILGRGARLVRQLCIRRDQSVDVDYTPYDADEPLQISVHGCEPDELESHRAALAGTPHRDADGLVRWVNAELDGVPVTFFRR